MTNDDSEAAQASAERALPRLLGHFGLNAENYRAESHDHSLAEVCTAACPGYAEVQRQKRAAMATTHDPDGPQISGQYPDGTWGPIEPLGWQGVSGKDEGWLRAHPRIPGALRLANALGRWEERGLG